MNVTLYIVPQFPSIRVGSNTQGLCPFTANAEEIDIALNDLCGFTTNSIS